MTIRTYTELIQLPTFEERLKYLRLFGTVGADTFGFDRYMNQKFYKSLEWKKTKEQIIIRDNGCDLGVEGHDIYGRIIVHHINPILPNDIRDATEYLLDPNYLITVSHDTHNTIHYGNESKQPVLPIERRPNDTSPWRLT